MAVDILALVDSLKAEVNAPGFNAFPNATDADWEGQLLNAFWECRLLGLFPNYTMDDNGSITPMAGTTDLPRDLQQAVVLVAGIRSVRGQLIQIKTSTHYKAGPVETTVAISANVLQVLFKDLTDKLKLVLVRLSDVAGTDAIVIDAVISRVESYAAGATWWVR